MSGEEREERLFQLHEALQAALEGGELHADSVYALRFDLEPQEVARARRALERLHEAGEPELELASSAELPAPELPADYELLGELGRGGMGVVYRVHQKSLDRDLALKVLRPGEAVARRALERFKREARSLARLRHPHIASLHEVGESGGRVYFTMDLIEGRSLAEHLRAGAATPSQAVRWMRQVTAAIHYVHSHGLVHRDIKPANILIDEGGDATVVDFGLARDVQVASDLTQSGHFLGTPAYMAPEQARGDSSAVGEATDIYAIGAVLYECLTGRRAFSGGSLVEVVAAVCAGDVVPPTRIDPKIPRGLERIGSKAMATEPEERYVSARALLEDFERFEAGLSVLAEAPSWRQRWRGFAARNRASLVAGAGTALATAALILLLVVPGLRRDSRDLLEVGRELASSGQARAAVSVYDAAWPAAPDLALLAEHGPAYARALLEVADLESAAQALPAARAAARRAEELTRRALERLEAAAPPSSLGEPEPFAAERLALLEGAIRARLHLGSAPDSLTQLAEGVRSLRGTLAAGALPLAGALVDAWPSELLLARASLPMLLDETSPAHAAALGLWACALDGPAAREAQRYLREEVPEREAVLVALLEAAGELHGLEADSVVPDFEGPQAPDWMRLVEACDGRRLREELGAALARRPAEARLRRFVGALCGLPGEVLESVDDAALRSLLDPVAHSGEGDLARRLALVLEHFAARPEFWSADADDWLRARVGLPRSVRRSQGLEGWSAWHAQLTPDSLGADLDAALDRERMVGELGPREWLARLERCTSPKERRLLHERLLLELPLGALPPFWPADLADPPPGLCAGWHAALAELVPPRSFAVRLAALRWELGQTQPTLGWEQRLELLEGRSFERVVEVQLPALARETNFAARFAGWFGPGRLLPPDSLQVRLTGRLDWQHGGLGLTWSVPRVLGSPLHLGASLPRGGIPAGEGRVSAAGLLDLRRRTSQIVGHELVLAILEPAGAPAEAWGVAQWRARLLAQQEAFRTYREQEVGPPRAQSAWLAQMFLLAEPPPPRAGGATRPDGSEPDPGGARLRRWVACGDAQERALLANSLDLAALAPDLRLRLAEAARAAGGELDPASARLARRDAEAAASRRRQAAVLWSLAGVVALLLSAGLFAALRGAYHLVKSGEWQRRWRETSREERALSALAMLPSSLVWIWYMDVFGWRVRVGGLFGELALAVCLFYSASILAWLASGTGSRLRHGPWILVCASGLFVIAEGAGWGSAGALAWPQGAGGASLWLALLCFPLAARELWSWVPDPARARRLERRGAWIYGLGVLLPFGWRVLDPDPGRALSLVAGPGAAGAGVVDLAASLLPVLGFSAWIWLLIWATQDKRRTLTRLAQARLRDRRRLQQRGAERLAESCTR